MAREAFLGVWIWLVNPQGVQNMELQSHFDSPSAICQDRLHLNKAEWLFWVVTSSWLVS